MKKLLKIPYYFLVAAVASIGILLLATLLPVPGNFKVKIVKSGSMEPAIKTGGIVVIRESSSYKVGDVITFGADTKTQIPTTHRIIEEKGSGNYRMFTTKGDANDAPDPKEVSLKDIRGKVLFTVPFVGYILGFAKKPIGFVLLVGIPALIIIFEEILNIWREIRNIKKKKSTKYQGYDLTEALPKEAEEQVYNRSNTLEMRSLYREGNVLDLRAKFGQAPKQRPSSNKSNYSNFSFRAVGLLLFASLPLLGLGRVGGTVSYYNEKESSLANILQASSDFGREVIIAARSISDFVPSLDTLSEEDVKQDTSTEEVAPPEDENIVEEDRGGEVVQEDQTEESSVQETTEETTEETVETEEPVVQEEPQAEPPVEAAPPVESPTTE